MIRSMREEEIPVCVEVIKESFLTVAEEFGFTPENAGRFTAFATTPERLAWHYHGEHRPMFVYEEDGQIVGYYSLLLQENEECELSNLSVLPKHRHGKKGQALMEHAFTQAKELGCKKMNIGIVEENVRLRKWYEELGAVHVGTQKYDFFPFTCGYLVKELG